MPHFVIIIHLIHNVTYVECVCQSLKRLILLSTGLMSPYSSKTDETVRLGVPEEVFKLIEKIRGSHT